MRAHGHGPAQLARYSENPPRWAPRRKVCRSGAIGAALSQLREIPDRGLCNWVKTDNAPRVTWQCSGSNAAGPVPILGWKAVDRDHGGTKDVVTLLEPNTYQSLKLRHVVLSGGDPGACQSFGELFDTRL